MKFFFKLFGSFLGLYIIETLGEKNIVILALGGYYNIMRKIREEDGVQKEWYQRAREMTLDGLGEFLRELSEGYEHGLLCML